MNIGILSTASIVPRFLRACRETETGRVLAIASRDPARADTFAARWSIPRSYGSYDALLADPDVALVYIATINSEHYRWALRAIESGKHVLLEKPFTLRASEAEHLFRAAREQGVFLAEAQKAVFLPVMQRLRAMIADGVIGPVHLADFTSSFPGAYNAWLHDAAAGGGALYSNGSYTVALSRFLFGRQIDACAGLGTARNGSADTQFAFALRMGGILAVSKISTDVPAQNRACIYAELGSVEIPDYWKARSAVVRLGTGQIIRLEEPCENELVYEIRHVLSCLEQGLLQSPVMTEEMTLCSVRTLEQLAQAPV